MDNADVNDPEINSSLSPDMVQLSLILTHLINVLNSCVNQINLMKGVSKARSDSLLESIVMVPSNVDIRLANGPSFDKIWTHQHLLTKKDEIVLDLNPIHITSTIICDSLKPPITYKHPIGFQMAFHKGMWALVPIGFIKNIDPNPSPDTRATSPKSLSESGSM